MIAELGHFALILAFILSFVQATLPVYGASRQLIPIMQLADYAARAQFICLGLAFACLTYAFIVSDFSLTLVANNSHVSKPLMYKIAGVWGNHEGSILLWVLVLAAYSFAFSIAPGKLAPDFRARVLAVQGWIGVAFLGFIIFTSNPFSRLFPAPFEGMGLNPVLQDPALAAHPPLLYIGYVGTSLAFAFAVAGLLSDKLERVWAQSLRVWVLVAWLFLTLGIALGSFWAYYELGWGGFWFWDPVENASLMPWLAGTALLHSVMVTAQRGAFMRWTILLAILTFGLSLVGTFLVRSGVLTSVHAFATDPERGVYILAILTLTIGGALLLYARARPKLASTQPFEILSRESALLLNNVFLATATATVFIGTLYPLFVDALGLGKISVGAPYFSTVFLPLMIPFVIVLPFGPFLSWQKYSGRRLVLPLSLAFIAALVFTLAYYSSTQASSWPAYISFLGAFWLVCGAIAAFLDRLDITRTGRLKRLKNMPPSTLASSLAHAGIGLMLMGIIGATAWKSERVVALMPGETIEIAGYEFVYEGTKNINGPNYRSDQASLRPRSPVSGLTELLPERRFYPAERGQTTEAAIDKRLSRNIYAALGEQLEDGSRVIRMWVHPLVALIWIGAVVMALGGCAGLRRRSVGS
jgi:cytochrome c-type biogenesis protein CcmF